MDATTPRLYRTSDQRVIAGVAQGLALHLRLNPLHVRIAFAALAFFNGLGVLLYAGFWAVVPQTRDGAPQGRRWRRDFGAAVAVGLLGLGLLLVNHSFSPFLPGSAFSAAMLAGAGTALLWWQADESLRLRMRQFTGRAGPSTWLRVLVGAALLLAGSVTFLDQFGGLSASRDAVLATAVLGVGVALLTTPWWRRLVDEAAAERRERIRSQERAELAAHLHDSVLHTLALIQRHVDSPREVARLARGQERQLRAWLNGGQRSSDTSQLAAALQAAAAEVEDTYAVVVEAVVVGDIGLDERLAALVDAAREAMVNAARHGDVESVSLYAEVEPDQVSVYVRDRGRGFDPEAVPDDRHGISGSIVGRMQRFGGTAEIRSSPGAGTEVELTIVTRAARSEV